MLTYSDEAKKGKKKWSGKVETSWHPDEGFFKKSPGEIARVLKKESKDRRQAMSRITFYMNRAGKNLSEADRKRLEAAKKILTTLYDEEEKKTKKTKVSTESYPSADW